MNHMLFLILYSKIHCIYLWRVQIIGSHANNCDIALGKRPLFKFVFCHVAVQLKKKKTERKNDFVIRNFSDIPFSRTL